MKLFNNKDKELIIEMHKIYWLYNNASHPDNLDKYQYSLKLLDKIHHN